MNKNEFQRTILDNKVKIDSNIKSYFKKDFSLYKALTYSVDSGKRIRASLYFETLKMLGHKPNDMDLSFAIAIEMIHAYSLVHDDLPAMDNDDFRRGKPSVHKKFGEDIGILTGDALLNESASILFDLSLKNPAYIKASKYLFDHSGYRGMIEGQVLDLKRDESYDLSYVLEVYKKKTADLFKASIISAALLSGLDSEKIEILESFAENLGLAFQLQDDLLEKSYNEELNILNIMDKSEAMDLLNDINQKAENDIREFSNNEFLLQLIDYLTKREN